MLRRPRPRPRRLAAPRSSSAKRAPPLRNITFAISKLIQKFNRALHLKNRLILKHFYQRFTR